MKPSRDTPPQPMTREEWIQEATCRFGASVAGWRFVCPSCGHVASAKDWRDAGAPDTAIAFSCVGRWTGADDSKTFKREGGPCIYAGGGLFRLNPLKVSDGGVIYEVFDFAEATDVVAV